jgi:hypothetical protein
MQGQIRYGFNRGFRDRPSHAVNLSPSIASTRHSRHCAGIRLRAVRFRSLPRGAHMGERSGGDSVPRSVATATDGWPWNVQSSANPCTATSSIAGKQPTQGFGLFYPYFPHPLPASSATSRRIPELTTAILPSTHPPGRPRHIVGDVQQNLPTAPLSLGGGSSLWPLAF